MSTVRRLYDDPRNSEVVNGRAVQRCCGGNAPYWDTYRIHDTEDAWDESTRNMTAYKQSDSILVQDDTGASDNDVEVVEYDINGKRVGSNDKMKGYVRVEGPNSGYRPDFLTVAQWMDWQGVEWSADPRGVKLSNGSFAQNMPNPPRWRRTRIRADKMKWGKGVGGWGGSDWVFLWCPKCETALEKAWSDTLTVLPIAARGIAMVVSYIPVYGTAISFCINATVTLAEGGSIDQAVLDGIGGALPGQPTSGMVFNAGVAIARGERIDKIAIAALPVTKDVKNLINVADDIIYGIANGEKFTEIGLGVIRGQLPPEAQQGMDYARRIINGENVIEMVLSETEKAVVHRVREEAQGYIDQAQGKGEQALGMAHEKAKSRFNQYVAEVGYQLALAKLPIDLRDALSTGVVVGVYTQASAEKPTPMFATAPERNVPVLDAYEAKGRVLVYGPKSVSKVARAGTSQTVAPDPNRAQYKGKFIADLLAGSSFTISVQGWDALNNVPRIEVHTDTITPEWKRGFLIGMGVSEGSSKDGPGQNAIYQSVAEAGGRRGFQAGQAVQFWRTTLGGRVTDTVDLSKHSAVLAALAPAKPALTATAVQSKGALLYALAAEPKAPASTLVQSVGLPTLAPALATPPTAIASPRTAPLVMDPSVYARKTADRARWVDYYAKIA